METGVWLRVTSDCETGSAGDQTGGPLDKRRVIYHSVHQMLDPPMKYLQLNII